MNMKRILNYVVIAAVAAASLNSCGGSTSGNKVTKDGKLKGELSLSGAFALYLVEDYLAQTDRLRCNLDILVSLDVLQRFLKREYYWRRKSNLLV